MRFLRKNIFMVVVVAAVLVSGAILIPLGSSAGLGGGVENAKKKRKDLNTQLDELGNRPANKLMIQDEKTRIAYIKQSKQDVVDQAVRWNQRNYNVPVVVYDTAKGARSTPVFPRDARLWLDYSLAFKAVVAHRELLAALRETLNPVQAYTQEELQAERERLERVRQREQKKSKPDATPKTATAVAAGPAVAHDPILTDNLAEKAQQYVIAKKSRQGNIYMEPGVIDSHALEDRAKPDEIYFGVVKYWIIGDIVRAVAQVNTRAAENARKNGMKNPGVPNLPVKELLRITIDSDAYGLRQRRAGFTGRATGTDYTVVQYHFSVVMPLGALPEFEQAMMSQNLHTVLDFQAAAVEPNRERYYGPEPVMKITLSGELLLLTEWERGNAATSELSGPEDILDWGALGRTLVRSAKSPTPSPGKYIWEKLTQSEKRLFLSADSLKESDRAALVRRLNALLSRRDFYSAGAWEKVQRPAYLQSLLHRLADGRLNDPQELLELNRGLLHAALPRIVRPSPHYPPLVPISTLEKLDKPALRQFDRDRIKQAASRP